MPDRDQSDREESHLRDMLAAYALTGLIQDLSPRHVPAIVQKAYEIADAMLVERRK